MITKLQILFTNRELAFFAWFIIVFGFILTSKSIRKSIGQLIVAFLKKKILSIILVAFIYSGSIILLLFVVRMWNSSMIKTSIYWYFMTALIILFNLLEANENKDYFKNIILDNLKFTLIIEFIVNIHNFSFWFEIIFIPIIFALSLLLAYTETDAKYKLVQKPISFILLLSAIILLILSIVDIVKLIEDYANFETLKAFLLPIILSISFVPTAYFIAVFMELEVLFKRYGIFLEDKKLLRYAKRRTLYKYGLRLQKIKSLTPIIMKEFYAGINKEEIKSILN